MWSSISCADAYEVSKSAGRVVIRGGKLSVSCFFFPALNADKFKLDDKSTQWTLIVFASRICP